MSSKWIDKSWRNVLSENLDDAISFFMPDIAADRDYGKAPFLLPPELSAIGGDSDKGMRTVDLAISIPMTTGPDQRLALHIEQQHAHDRDFPWRMFQGHYRMSDQYRIPVTSLAIFTGNISPVSTYLNTCYGTRVQFDFNFYHVQSVDVKELENDPRIFAVVILAAKRMLDAGGSPQKRGQYSLELLDLLAERGYDNKKARSLQRFVYRILQIKNSEIDAKVREVWNMQLIPIDEAVKEIYVRDALEEGMERGMERGKKIGREEGQEEKALQVARSMLDDGFSTEAIQKHTGLARESILALS